MVEFGRFDRGTPIIRDLRDVWDVRWVSCRCSYWVIAIAALLRAAVALTDRRLLNAFTHLCDRGLDRTRRVVGLSAVL